MHKFWSVLFVASPLLLGCRQAPTASTQIVIGTIDAGGTLDRVITGPATGVVGERLSLTVSTFGNACITAAGADVNVGGLEATVTPYDRAYQGACIDILKAYPRPVTVTFDQPGEATVRVVGRSFYQAGLVTVEHHLSISP